MKVYQSNEIKNIALLGSKGSGKTTLAEAMLYECGVIKRRGSVEAQNTVPGRERVWILGFLYRFLCRVFKQETECHRLPGSRRFYRRCSYGHECYRYGRYRHRFAIRR